MTTEPACNFLERRGLLIEQQGGRIDDHLAGCPRCREGRRRIASVEKSLGQIPLPGSTGHWEQAVWSKLSARQATVPVRGGWGRGRLLAGAGGTGLLVLVITLGAWLWKAGDGALAPEPHLAMRFEDRPERIRAEGQVAAGDTAVFQVRGLGQGEAELRVYRDDAGLVLRCSTAPPCRRQGDQLTARWPVPALGRYRVLVVAGAGPLPVPGGSYDEDASALQAASGVAVQLEQSFEVW